ncbi:hypothetical protein EXN66_Car021714 [Channa argus]|uniref:Uncharacterized protein n=1 Tax=Channa argus TaxID=215402 RepID=A0A6G1QUP3_CHAAH|nr:hypothetical protein EXN66_Car021714 [Channa argus]
MVLNLMLSITWMYKSGPDSKVKSYSQYLKLNITLCVDEKQHSCRGLIYQLKH